LWLAAQITDGTLPQLDRRLFEPGALALIAGALIVFYLSDGLRLYFVLRALDVTVRFRKLLPLVFINILFSNVTPLASGGGVAQVWYLDKIGVPVGTAAAATSIRTILAMSLIFVAAPLFQTLHPNREIAGMAAMAAQTITALVLLYLAGFGILLIRPFWLVRIVEAGLKGLRIIGALKADRELRWINAIRRETSAFSHGFREFLNARAVYSFAAIFWTVAFLLTLLSLPALLMTLLGYDINWITAIGAMAGVTFLMYFAPTPGGAGFAELAFAGLMTNQISSNDLLFVIIAWRFLTSYMGMAIGVVVSAFVFGEERRTQ
jgi:uncharacterized protein (TIRG00374 family)